MIDRLAQRWAPLIIVSGIALGIGWLAYAAVNSYGSAASYSARTNNK